MKVPLRYFNISLAADNLPVGPASLAVAPVHVAEPVVDTPEVVEAKAAFFKAYDAAKSGIAKRSAQIPLNYAAIPAAGLVAGSPLNYAALASPAFSYAATPAIAAPAIAAPSLTYAAAPAIAAPLSYATPAIASPALTYAGAPAREAVLTTIKLNPGHAVAYRVD